MKKSIAFCAILLVCMVGCQQKNPYNDKLKYSGNAVYYWQTWFSLDEQDQEFLDKNSIHTIYLRFFDVDINQEEFSNDKCAPVATVSIADESFGNLRIVPVVFITPAAIKEYESFTDNLAHRLYAMCKKNSISIDEVQFDCDWTESTKAAYFQFIKEIRPALKEYFKKEIAISSTIRLHQLTQEPPAVDYGVLMCYNTGNFKDFKTDNSILDVKDVEKYAKHLKKYALPLKLALPDFSWDVEFDGNHQFVRLNRGDYDERYDSTHLKHLEGNMYAVLPVGEEETTKYIRHEVVSAETILKSKALVEKYYGNMPVVLYHLDNKQLSKYSDDEIKAFFD
jgi:hypothetical protein